jgi:mannose-6-phosphate isomerase-like protein (cupin superfamily)
MKHLKTGTTRGSFEVLANTRSAQAAMMVLPPGKSTGQPMNEHPHSEQWLFVVSGTGMALVNRQRTRLRKNSLLLIEKGEIHQIRNTGRRPLVTLNFYTPTAYAKDGTLKKK